MQKHARLRRPAMRASTNTSPPPCSPSRVSAVWRSTYGTKSRTLSSSALPCWNLVSPSVICSSGLLGEGNIQPSSGLAAALWRASSRE